MLKKKKKVPEILFETPIGCKSKIIGLTYIQRTKICVQPTPTKTRKTEERGPWLQESSSTGLACRGLRDMVGGGGGVSLALCPTWETYLSLSKFLWENETKNAHFRKVPIHGVNDPQHIWEMLHSLLSALTEACPEADEKGSVYQVDSGPLCHHTQDTSQLPRETCSYLTTQVKIKNKKNKGSRYFSVELSTPSKAGFKQSCSQECIRS